MKVAQKTSKIAFSFEKEEKWHVFPGKEDAFCCLHSILDNLHWEYGSNNDILQGFVLCVYTARNIAQLSK